VNYRSTETLYFNEYWYEHENIRADHDITFSVQSSPSVISFAIFNLPFDYLPTTTKIGSYKENINVNAGGYEYYSIFLNSQSTIRYNYTATSTIDFFIADGDNLYEWDYGGPANFYKYIDNDAAETGEITVDESKDYYLVWYNDESSLITVDAKINYTALGVPDITGAKYFVEATDTVSQDTYTVPSDGNWYFFVYFDPMNAPEYSTSITFDVTYDTGINSTERWLNVQPVLIILIIILGILIILAIIARAGQKKRDSKLKAKKATRKTVKKATPIKSRQCSRCGANLKKGANFCSKCGGKVMGRKPATAKVTTSPKSKSCAFCGSRIASDDTFCKYCGTKIE
jgi:hypothetical protein